MNRAELEKLIEDMYSADAECLWAGHPNYHVFRHDNNKKWFALIMDIPREKLGLPEKGMLDIVNVKCDPIIIGSFSADPGIYPAYHMNKASWLSIALDGSADDETITLLLNMSFDLTSVKAKKRRTEIT